MRSEAKSQARHARNDSAPQADKGRDHAHAAARKSFVSNHLSTIHHQSRLAHRQGFTVIAMLFGGLIGKALGSAEPAPLEQALTAVQDCMTRSPAPWPEAWQREYLDAIRKALASDPNLPDCAAKLEVFRRGFMRYWAQGQGFKLTQLEYDLRKSETRWYCETLMSQDLPSTSERAILKGQLRDLCDYAGQYLKGRFPFLTPVCLEEAKKSVLTEFDQEVDSPLLPIFRRPLSDAQVRAVKANWGRLYRRWHFIWRDVRYGGPDLEGASASTDPTKHPHCRFVKRCLLYLPGMIWPTVEKPPGYVTDVIRKLNAEKAERGRVNRQGAEAERELAMRSSNQVEQVEEWSFVFTALLETANAGNGQRPSPAHSPKGGDAYDLNEQP
jgi:hypothetical protein